MAISGNYQGLVEIIVISRPFSATAELDTLMGLRTTLTKAAGLSEVYSHGRSARQIPIQRDSDPWLRHMTHNEPDDVIV